MIIDQIIQFIPNLIVKFIEALVKHIAKDYRFVKNSFDRFRLKRAKKREINTKIL
ncbi:MAG TPA: hypothetical protein VJJ23_05460 [Candidatus Nanoarchaeia archaeon]|nr:hypothetical protein [Candidatus Nanoarchaeia archaeon]